ncbi:MAG: hypothetical protein ACPGD7_16880, partial [bacterium]
MQNPLFQKAKEKYVPGEKVPFRADEGWGKTLIPGPHPPYATAPLTRRARVILWMMDSATPPCGCAQNDGIAGGVQ